MVGVTHTLSCCLFCLALRSSSTVALKDNGAMLTTTPIPTLLTISCLPAPPPQQGPHSLPPQSPPPPPPPQLFLSSSKRGRSTDRNSVSPSTLKHCADRLSPAFPDILTSHVSACFKTSTIIPVPRKPRPSGLNDYGPFSLTSVVMKYFERLVLSRLKSITDPPPRPPAVLLQSQQVCT